MGVKLATTVLQWSHSIVHHSSAYSQTVASARRDSGAVVFSYIHRFHRFGTQSMKLHRSKSFPIPKSRFTNLKRACSESLDSNSDEEFSKQIQELAMKFQLTGNDDDDEELNSELDISDSTPSPWPRLIQELSDLETADQILSEIERKANSVDLPLSLRIIRRKMKWQENITQAGESAYCSVKKAFSSMVFIIQQIHSYTLQMREILYYEDLQGILIRVQKEMQQSFVWLFQQVFSPTPTLMIYVMILLANFTVHSMENNTAMAASSINTTEIVSVKEIQNNQADEKLSDYASNKIFSVSIGGDNGGSGKVPMIASGTDENGRFEGLVNYQTIFPENVSQKLNSVSGEKEAMLWNSIVEEAKKMEMSLRDESLDQETMKRFVSPVNARIEGDDYTEYITTEILYQMELSQNPNQSLLLANFAQFLFLVANDYNRAEEYFKKATAAEPPDAEACNKYAWFLWRVRKDVWAAEETFLEAIAVEPNNTYYGANFLWTTGVGGTCFPLTSPHISAPNT